MTAPTERFVLANGLRHHVLEWDGGGEPVVLLHGFLDLAWSWDAVAKQLADAGYRVIAFDFRGHGESEWIGAGGYYHFSDYVLDLAELLPQITEGPVHLVGHSMGGTVACMFAGSFGDRIRSLTLVEGLGIPPHPLDDAPERLRTWVRSVQRVRSRAPRLMADAAEALGRMRMRAPELPDDLGLFLAERGTRPVEGGVEWRFDPLHRTPSPHPFRLEVFRTFLEGIGAPTLVVAGEQGFRLPDEDERRTWLGPHRFVEVPAVGHMIHWFAPGALANALLPFLRAPDSV
jgi:pimeloyl-ACP methyl ester carboxylesterase